MTFPTLADAIAARKDSHGSWPYMVAEIEANPVKAVPTRRAQLSARASPYKHETTGAHKTTIAPFLYYDQPRDKPERTRSDGAQ